MQARNSRVTGPEGSRKDNGSIMLESSAVLLVRSLALQRQSVPVVMTGPNMM